MVSPSSPFPLLPSLNSHKNHSILKYQSRNKKGDKNIYKSIKEFTGQAIINAKKVNEAVDKTGTDNPSTLIHDLVKYLQELGRL